MAIKQVRIEKANLRGATIWDVRDEKSFRNGHLASAINMPLNNLTPESLATIDPKTPIHILCGGGTKAGKAVALLEQFDPTREYIELKGGTRAAKTAGLPIMITEFVYEPL